jgi:hypothetical protein
VFLPYSKKAFSDAKENKEQLKRITSELHAEVQRRLHPLVLAELEAIVAALNACGHNLRHRYPPVPGEIHFRDTHSDRVDLLIACDTVVTVDFGSAIEDKELIST